MVNESGGWNAMTKNKTQKKKVLVGGASGLLGVAATEKFLSAGWKVVGVDRRKPELPSGRNVEFLPVDLTDKEAARSALEPLTDITHLIYAAIFGKSQLVAGRSSRDQIETNNAMLRNLVEPIVRAASHFQHISILQGTKVYGVHLHPIPALRPQLVTGPTPGALNVLPAIGVYAAIRAKRVSHLAL